MKRDTIALAATSGLVGLAVLAGSLAYASTTDDPFSAAALRRFLAANPKVAAAVADVEAKTGGKVAGAGFDEEAAAGSIVDFDVMIANGSEQSVFYKLADGAMTVAADDN